MFDKRIGNSLDNKLREISKEKINTLYESLSQLNEEDIRHPHKKALNEGAGAGYNVNGELSNVNITKINSITIKNDEDSFFHNDYAIIDVEGTADFEGTAESYYDGAPCHGKVEIDSVEVNINILDYNDIETYNDITVDTLNNAFYSGINLESETIGRGWTHQKFDGFVKSSNSNTPYEIDEVDFHFIDQDVIDFIDLAVSGENYSTEYYLWDRDENYEPMGFDSDEQAIEFAKNNGYVKVESSKYFYDQDGDTIGDYYSDQYETIWEKETEIEESLGESLKESKDNLTIEEMFNMVGVENVFDKDGYFTPEALKVYDKVGEKFFDNIEEFDKLCDEEKCFKETEENLNESSNQLDEYKISENEVLILRWDKGDTYSVIKAHNPGNDLWVDDFRKTFGDEKRAREAFKRYVRKFKEKSLKEDTKPQRTLYFTQVADNRFTDNLEDTINKYREDIVSKLSKIDNVSIHTDKVRTVEFDDGTKQLRQDYFIQKQNNKVSWNDIYEIINSINARPYKFINNFYMPPKKNESLKEDWAHFSFKSGSNPYIAKTEKEKEKILKKYKNKVKELKPNFYEIDDMSKNIKEKFEGNKTVLDLTIFDDNKIFQKKFGSLEELDAYIKEISGIDLEVHSSSDKDTAKDSFERNYSGDYHYFNTKGGDKIGDAEAYAMLRTDVDKYEDGYGVSYYDFGYHMPGGWGQVDQSNIEVIESPKSHKGHWRKQELGESIKKPQKKISANEFKRFARKNKIELDNIVNAWEEEFGKMTLKEWIELTINTYKDLNSDLAKEKGTKQFIKSNEIEIIEPLEKLLSTVQESLKEDAEIYTLTQDNGSSNDKELADMDKIKVNATLKDIQQAYKQVTNKRKPITYDEFMKEGSSIYDRVIAQIFRNQKRNNLKEDLYIKDDTPIKEGDYIIFNTLDDELSDWKDEHPSKNGYKVTKVDRELDGTPTGMYFIKDCPYAIDYNEDNVEKIQVEEIKVGKDPKQAYAIDKSIQRKTESLKEGNTINQRQFNETLDVDVENLIDKASELYFEQINPYAFNNSPFDDEEEMHKAFKEDLHDIKLIDDYIEDNKNEKVFVNLLNQIKSQLLPPKPAYLGDESDYESLKESYDDLYQADIHCSDGSDFYGATLYDLPFYDIKSIKDYAIENGLYREDQRDDLEVYDIKNERTGEYIPIELAENVKGALKEDNDPYHNHIQYKVTLKDKDGTYTEILEVPEYVRAQDKDFDTREYFKDFYQLDDEDIIKIEQVGYYSDDSDVNVFKYNESLKENLSTEMIQEIEKELEDILKRNPKEHSFNVDTEEIKDYVKERLQQQGYEVEISGEDRVNPNKYHIEYYKKELKEDYASISYKNEIKHGGHYVPHSVIAATKEEVNDFFNIVKDVVRDYENILDISKITYNYKDGKGIVVIPAQPSASDRRNARGDQIIGFSKVVIKFVKKLEYSSYKRAMQAHQDKTIEPDATNYGYTIDIEGEFKPYKSRNKDRLNQYIQGGYGDIEDLREQLDYNFASLEELVEDNRARDYYYKNFGGSDARYNMAKKHLKRGVFTPNDAYNMISKSTNTIPLWAEPYLPRDVRQKIIDNKFIIFTDTFPGYNEDSKLHNIYSVVDEAEFDRIKKILRDSGVSDQEIKDAISDDNVFFSTHDIIDKHFNNNQFDFIRKLGNIGRYEYESDDEDMDESLSKKRIKPNKFHIEYFKKELKEDYEEEPIIKYGVLFWYNLKGNYDIAIFNDEYTAEKFADEYSEAYDEWYHSEYENDEDAINTLETLVQPIFDKYSKDYESEDEIFRRNLNDNIYDRYGDGSEIIKIVDSLDYGY